MVHFPTVGHAIWISSVPANVLLIRKLAKSKNPALAGLRALLVWETVPSAVGLLVGAFLSVEAYFYEYTASQLASLVGNVFLLYGVWRSFPKPSRQTGQIVAAAFCLIALLGILSAEQSLNSMSSMHARIYVTIRHVSGYGCTLAMVLIAFVTWIRGNYWSPAVLRVFIGHSLYIASTFGIEQSQVILRVPAAPWLTYVPALTYFLSLLVWSSAISLENPQPLSAEQKIVLNLALAENINLRDAAQRAPEDE